MNFNEILEISKKLDSSSVSCVLFEDGRMVPSRTIRSDTYLDSGTFCDLRDGKDNIKVSDSDIDYFVKTIPVEFSAYIHSNGNFYSIDYENKVLNKIGYDVIPKDAKIFDLSKNNGSDDIYDSIIFVSSILKNAIKNYYKAHTYNPERYTITKRIEMPCSAYDYDLSLTKEESDKISKWENKHYKKYHKNESSKGAISVSNFEVKFQSTSIGTYCDCICNNCLEKARYAESIGDDDLATKLKKEAIFEVRGL
jgi:hypothetical protein